MSKFARFKFKDFSRISKYFQAPYLFSSTFKGLEVFIPNSSIFKDFSSTLRTLGVLENRFTFKTVMSSKLVHSGIVTWGTAKSLHYQYTQTASQSRAWYVACTGLTQ